MRRMIMQNTLVYPRDYLNKKRLIDRKKCFFVMPYNDKCNSTYAHLSDALRKHDYTPIRVDFIPSSQTIMHNVLEELTTSNYVIVDISGENPNVFYELGIAHVFKDVRNVILIKDKDTKAPTDITHIRYTEYSKENYMLLEETIIKMLEEMSYITELELALSGVGLINAADDTDYIFSVLENGLNREQLSIITKVLTNDTRSVTESDMLDVYNATEKMLSVLVLNNHDKRIIDVFFSLYATLLVNCPFVTVISKKLEKILSNDRIINDSRIDLSLKTDIALKFLYENKMCEIVMPWIIEYFSRSKSTHIDLNRYKIEAFLTNKDEERFDNYIIMSLSNKDRHIREHMADIVAEKELRDAAPQLRKQLIEETNIYSASSNMEALGKVGTYDDISIIENWIEKNFNMINNPGGNMVFKHALSAIIMLEKENGNTHSLLFEKKYGTLFIH